jgi:DNA-directed RNA polymerase specialized sigma24 family protein
MVERFFDELRRGVPGAAADKATDPPEQNEKSQSDTKRDESFLAAVPTIRQIVWRKLFARKPDDAPDLIQKVILQLLTWRKNNPNKIEEMTADEWQSFASKAAHNAVNNSLSSKEHLIGSLDEASEAATDDQVAGNTKAELASLLSRFWQGICQLSLRQRRALLLGSDSLLVLLRLYGVSNQNLSEILEISERELLDIIPRLPLKDAQIAHLIAALDGKDAKNRNTSSLAKSVKKARHEARASLQKLLSE